MVKEGLMQNINITWASERLKNQSPRVLTERYWRQERWITETQAVTQEQTAILCSGQEAS